MQASVQADVDEAFRLCAEFVEAARASIAQLRLLGARTQGAGAAGTTA